MMSAIANTATLGGLRVTKSLDWRPLLAQYDARLLADPEGRRTITRTSPILFSLIYMRHHLVAPETGGEVTFSRFHWDLAESARLWVRDDLGPAELREAVVAPRGSGKSTWLFGILPIWALAHGHRRYIAAFADSGPQAQQHLMSVKRELDTNMLLRRDFPGLVSAARRPSGTTVSDNQGLLLTESGAVFQAKGIDSSTLGAKVGSQRPDLLLFDDIEPSASNYSAYQKEKRQDTIINAVFPMGLNAVVVLAGTTTMYGSVMHDIARQATDPGNTPSWVGEENIKTRYYPAIVTQDDGTEVSLWPERWTIEYLQSIRHTRSFALNYMNMPMSLDGGFWTPAHWRYDAPTAVTRRILSVDPAITTKAHSDFSGLAVIGYDPSAGRAVVEHTAQVKLSPGHLRAHILRLLDEYPGIKAVVLEDNQGKDLWLEILSPLPVQLIRVHQDVKKEIRAAKVLDYYDAGWVAHAGPQPAFEDQALIFPNGAHDDVVDSVVTGVDFFLKDRKRPQRAPTTSSYV